MAFEINGKTYETDEEGYLADLSDWNAEVADHMATEDDCDLSENHWEVINFLRDYYEEYQIAPAVRVLTKAIGNDWVRIKVTVNIFMSFSLMGRPSRPVSTRAYPSQPAASECSAES